MTVERETARAARRARPPVTGVIRAYEPRDREAVRDICRRTAYRNRGSDAVFEDGELFADYWTKYYTDHEPESCTVVEEDGVVIGYLLGCRDARVFQRTMAVRIVPSIVARAVWRLGKGRYRNPTTRKMLRWLATSAWKEEPEIPLDRYPAHYHCNVLRQGIGKGYYSALAIRFIDYLKQNGVAGIHGQIEEAEAGGPWRQMVDAYVDYLQGSALMEHFAEKPSTFQKAVLGVDKPIMNRAWGARLDSYRGWLVWAAEKYHM